MKEREAIPFFFDADHDGLLDMLIGNFGYFDKSNINLYVGKISYYKNTGDGQHPEFKLITTDYAGLSALNIKFVPPSFGDLDGDGDADMITGQEDGTLLFFKNIAAAGAPADFIFFGANYAGIDVGSFSAPQLVDVNRDSLLDLVIGEQSGNLNYYENVGSASSPDFLWASDFWGGVDVRQGYITGYSCPFLFDDNDGDGYQLLVGSEQGNIFKYSNIDNNLDGLFTVDETVFNNIRVGKRASISGNDADGDGKADLLIGNYRGGVTFYDRKTTGTMPQPNHQNDGLEVYPNPASKTFEVRMGGGLPEGRMDFSLLNLFGQKMLERGVFASEKETFDVSSLPPGIYFFVAEHRKSPACEENYRML